MKYLSGMNERFSTRITSACIVTLLVLNMLWLAGATLTATVVVLVLIGAMVVLLSGELVLQMLGLYHIRCYLPLAYVIGSAVTSLVMLPIVWWCHLTAATTFALWAAIVAPVVILRGYLRTRPTDDWVDTIIIGIAAIIVGFFCRHVAAAAPSLEVTGVLNAWVDNYLHGYQIAQFGDSHAVGRGMILLVDEPREFYHYAFYMLASALLGITHLSGLAISTSILLPLGLLIGSLGIYGLGATLGNRVTGVACILVLTFLPDPSRYGLRNEYFSFPWWMFSIPGSGYAIGIASAAQALVVYWQRHGGKFIALFGILLMASLLMFRAHIFLIALPACMGCFVLTYWHDKARYLVGLAIAMAIIAAIVLSVDSGLREAWLNFSQFYPALAQLHGLEPTAYPGLYASLVQHYGHLIASTIGMVLLLPDVLGVFALFYPILVVRRIVRGDWDPVDYFPPLLITAFFLAVLFAPPMGAGQGIDELKQRHFVFVYATIVLWTVFYAGELMSAIRPIRFQPAASLVGLFIGVISLLIGSRNFDPSQARVAWMIYFNHKPIEPGISAVAAFIRSNVAPDDVLSVGGTFKKLVVDPATELVSLTNLPAYTARDFAYVVRPPGIAEEAKRRVNYLENVNASADVDSARTSLQREGIRWYIYMGGAPRWDPGSAHASFRTQSISVYDTASSAMRIPLSGRP